jgi:hypothetical protein
VDSGADANADADRHVHRDRDADEHADSDPDGKTRRPTATFSDGERGPPGFVRGYLTQAFAWGHFTDPPAPGRRRGAAFRFTR